MPYCNFKKYFAETKMPYYSLLFILPFFIVYEIGFFTHAKDFTINFGDWLLRYFYYFLISFFGTPIIGILVGITIIGLIGYSVTYYRQKRPKINLAYLLLMFVEAILLCFAWSTVYTLVMSRTFPKFFTFTLNPAAAYQAQVTGMTGFWPVVFGSIGAGVFEELVFRVLALRLLYEIMKPQANPSFGSDQKTFLVVAIIVSIVFSLLHLSQVTSILSLLSIFVSSLFMSFLYRLRGYGITAGFHIFWDLFGFWGIT